MATPQEDTKMQVDIEGLKKDVSYLTKQADSQDKKLDTVIVRLDGLSFVPEKDYIDDKKELDLRLKQIEANIELTKPVVKVYTTITSRVLQIILFGILGAALAFIAANLSKFIGAN